jgi:endonuclease/exonuclease/phosphatase family metal-dependent hydrolase
MGDTVKDLVEYNELTDSLTAWVQGPEESSRVCGLGQGRPGKHRFRQGVESTKKRKAMTDLRIMTFNINGAAQEQSAHSWARRAALNVRTIRRYAPDLLGLQEVEPHNWTTYDQSLTDYRRVDGHMYDEPPDAAFASIYWRDSRFTLIEQGEFWFSRTPDVRSSDYGIAYPIGATWVRLQERQTDVQVLHTNTHFEDAAEGETSRIEGSKLMVAYAAQLAPDLPVFVTGDFNCNPWSVPYTIFVEHGFTDTYRTAGHGDSVASNTYHGYVGDHYFALDWGGAEADLFWRIDWILARNGAQRVLSKSCTIVRDAESSLYPSDHYPGQ